MNQPNHSDRFSLNGADVEKWAHNALKFFAPAFIVYLTVIKTGGSQEEALIALKLWGLNTGVDLLSKFLAEK